MKTFLLVCLLVVSQVLGHSYMTTPIPIGLTTATDNPQTGSTAPACGLETSLTSPSTAGAASVVINAGAGFPISWPLNSHSGGTVTLAYLPQTQVSTIAANQAADDTAFAGNIIGTSAYGTTTLNAVFPASTVPGMYIIQWKWVGGSAGGPWYSCALAQVLGNPPNGATANPSAGQFVYTLAGNAGTYNAATGTFTCNQGFQMGTMNGQTTCVPNVSGAGAFGIVVLVLVVVGVAVTVGVMIFLKKKRPETYDRVIEKVKEVPSKVKGLFNRGGSAKAPTAA